MAFILRHRSEPLPEDEARLESAREVVRRFDSALVRLVDRDNALDDVARRRVARLTDCAIDCKEDLDEAQWRYLKGDRLGAEQYLAEAIERAEDGIRAIDDPRLQH